MKNASCFQDFSVRICYGHTPGLMIPVIRYKDKTLVYTGDLIPTAAHIPLIWNMSYDIESLKTIDEKRSLSKRLSQIIIFLYSSTTNQLSAVPLK